MQTGTDIVNAALLRIGAQTISSFEENSTRARKVKLSYPQARRNIIRLHNWDCATKRVTLSATTTAPSFGYSKTINLPNDFLKVKSVNQSSYTLEGSTILCDSQSIELIYLFDNQNVKTWDATLAEAVILKLAGELAQSLASNVSLSERLKGELERHVRRARAVDSQQTPSQSLDLGESSTLISARG